MNSPLIIYQDRPGKRVGARKSVRGWGGSGGGAAGRHIRGRLRAVQGSLRTLLAQSKKVDKKSQKIWVAGHFKLLIYLLFGRFFEILALYLPEIWQP